LLAKGRLRASQALACGPERALFADRLQDEQMPQLQLAQFIRLHNQIIKDPCLLLYLCTLTLGFQCTRGHDPLEAALKAGESTRLARDAKGDLMDARNEMLRQLASRKDGYGLPQAFYADPDFYRLDLEHIFYREWLFAGHNCELPKSGSYLTLQIAKEIDR
jgi:hypothetical protein